jgi:hypothetical protein
LFLIRDSATSVRGKVRHVREFADTQGATADQDGRGREQKTAEAV